QPLADKFGAPQSGCTLPAFDVPFMAKFLERRFDQSHALGVQLLVLYLRVALQLSLQMPRALMIEPGTLGADELETRQLRTHPIIDIAKVAEEPLVQDTDAFHQRALDKNGIARKQDVFSIGAAFRAELVAGEALALRVGLDRLRRFNLMLGMAIGVVRRAAHDAD